MINVVGDITAHLVGDGAVFAHDCQDGLLKSGDSALLIGGVQGILGGRGQRGGGIVRRWQR